MLGRALAQLTEIAGRDRRAAAGLDEDRLRFFQLCTQLDLVAGPRVGHGQPGFPQVAGEAWVAARGVRQIN